MPDKLVLANSYNVGEQFIPVVRNERNKWLGQGNQKSSHEHSQHE